MRALISHTGAIIQNKLTHHRPQQQKDSLLRMMANNDALGTSPTARPGTAHSNYSRETFNIQRPSTGYSTMSRTAPSIFRSDAASISGASSLSRTSDPGAEDEGGLFGHALGRHFTNLSMVSTRFGNGTAAKEDDNEEMFVPRSPSLKAGILT
jgi:hypothetical protein